MVSQHRLAPLFFLVPLLVALVAIRADSAATSSLIVLDPSNGPLPKHIMTDKGKCAVDQKTGHILPEEMDDGELEGGDHHITWNYNNQNSWSQEYPLCNASGMRQSPIDIQLDDLNIRDDMKLEFIDWDQDVEFELKNTHHSISAKPVTFLSHPSVRLSWLPDCDVFELQDIHFHWGDGVNKGSEHEINNQRAAAEMHMVHYQRGINKTDIGSIENSVVVIGVFIETDKKEHNTLEGLVAAASNINGTDAEYRDENPKNLINLLPDSFNSFYTYNGSLTTPPCYEVVTWVLMSNPVYLSHEKLIELSNIEANTTSNKKMKISSNHRDVQPLLDRPVFASFNTSNAVIVDASESSRFRTSFDTYWTRISLIRSGIRNSVKSVVNSVKNVV